MSGISLQRNGGLFGNYVNHVNADKQGFSHLTTVTQRPLQILPLSHSVAAEPTTTVRRASGGDRQINPSPIHNHCHHPHSYTHPACHQSPIPSNANLNNANVPSLLAMNTGRQQRCLLRRDRPSSTKNGSSVSTYSKGVHDKLWKSQSSRSVDRAPKSSLNNLVVYDVLETAAVINHMLLD